VFYCALLTVIVVASPVIVVTALEQRDDEDFP